MAFKRKGYRGRYRRLRRRTYRKRYGRRRMRATSNPLQAEIRRNRVVNLMGRNVFPQRVKVKMNYIACPVITATTGSTYVYCFRGNGVYDPDQTMAGAQPSCYDDLSSIYGFYTVLSSSLKVTAINVTDEPALVCIFPYTASNDTTNIEECSLMPRAKMVTIASQVGGGKAYLKSFERTSKIYTGTAMTDLDFMAASNTNPSRQWFWVIKVRSQDATNTATVNLTVKLTYYVVWSGRLNQAED